MTPDLTGDGVSDLIALVRLDNSREVIGLHWIDGANGAQLRFVSKNADVHVDGGVLTIDYDEDGFPDILTVRAQDCAASIISARSGTIVKSLGALYSSPKGSAPAATYGSIPVANYVDYDTDGTPDFLMTVGDEKSGAAVILRSGADGKMIKTYPVKSGQVASILVAPDLTEDGFPEILIGNKRWPAGRGSVMMLDGKRSESIWTSEGFGEAEFDGFGHAMALIGDVNTDGVPDLVCSANGDGTTTADWTPMKGYVNALSGIDGRTLWTMECPEPSHVTAFGFSLVLGGDINSDGYRDLVVGRVHYYKNEGTVWFVCSRSGQILRTIQLDWLGGTSFAVLGDCTENTPYLVVGGALQFDNPFTESEGGLCGVSCIGIVMWHRSGDELSPLAGKR